MPDKLSTQFKYQRLDRTTCRLNGYIVAEFGDFKTGRGSFSAESLKKICELINTQPSGVKCHFGHDNQLGKFLGRARNARITGVSVRADLYFDPTAMEPPPLGGGMPLTG